LQAARVPVKTGLPEGCDVADAYAACDLVAFPSTWEGFGNPALESAIRRRPLAIGDYPVARELAAFGFDWFGADDVEGIREFFARGDQGLIEANFATAARHFASEGLPTSIRSLIEAAGWWR
ncbi:MAG: hypothetical protein ACRD0E_04980, partial [Acidimicrobiales bacterium]